MQNTQTCAEDQSTERFHLSPAKYSKTGVSAMPKQVPVCGLSQQGALDTDDNDNLMNNILKG